MAVCSRNGQAASLHSLRRQRIVALVRPLRRYYPPVRLPVAVHWWCTSSDFPPRPVAPSPTGGRGISRFSREVCPCMLRVCDRARRPCLSPSRDSACCLPLSGTASAPRITMISRLNSSPALPPVNASHRLLRAGVHDSGPV